MASDNDMFPGDENENDESNVISKEIETALDRCSKRNDINSDIDTIVDDMCNNGFWRKMHVTINSCTLGHQVAGGGVILKTIIVSVNETRVNSVFIPEASLIKDVKETGFYTI